MELTENPSDGDELGVLLHDDSWFVVFTFDESGYVKDDEKDKLVADKILASIKQGTEQANEVRAERGWAAMEILGWQQAPFYDPGTHNLTWSIRGRSDGGSSINHSARLLGRRGVMQATAEAPAYVAFTNIRSVRGDLNGLSINGQLLVRASLTSISFLAGLIESCRTADVSRREIQIREALAAAADRRRVQTRWMKCGQQTRRSEVGDGSLLVHPGLCARCDCRRRPVSNLAVAAGRPGDRYGGDGDAVLQGPRRVVSGVAV
jgi:hypothetical protein